jgi:uncharacterized protein YjbJ (UPF0337 family)
MSDILSGMWKQVRGQVKQTWGDLTDDDLTEIEGSRDKLVGKLQERYGWQRAKAENEVDNFLARHSQNPRM